MIISADYLPYERPSSNKYYWKSDVYRAANELGKLDGDVSLRKPNATQIREKFVTQRMADVKYARLVSLSKAFQFLDTNPSFIPVYRDV